MCALPQISYRPNYSFQNREIAAILIFVLASVISLAGQADMPESHYPHSIQFTGNLSVQRTLLPQSRVVKFRILNDAQVELFSETQTVNLAADGSFAVKLGATASLPAKIFEDSAPRWIEYSDGTTTQRAPLTTVPYAFHSAIADSLSADAIANFIDRDSLSSEIHKVLEGTDLSRAGSTVLALQSPTIANPLATVIQADQLEGADFGEILQACVRALPAGGGICDARNLASPNLILAPIVIDRNTSILLGNVALNCATDPCFTTTANLRISGYSPTQTSIKTSAGGRLLTVSGLIVKNIEMTRLTLSGNGAGSQVVAIPNWAASSQNFEFGHYNFHDLTVQDFGATALSFGRSCYFFDVRRVTFLRNNSSVSFDRFAEGRIEDNFFYTPTAGPQITAVASSITHIERNIFINDGKNVDPDILISVPTDGNDGYLWIVGNKFGSEAEVAGRYKIELRNPASTRVSMAVNIQENNFSGISSSRAAIHLANLISNWSVQNNLFVNYDVAVLDEQPQITSLSVGHSIFAGNRFFTENGKPTAAFANGGRGFETVQAMGEDRVIATANTENRILNSERQDLWRQNGTTTQCGNSDPYGSQRACRITRAGKVSSESAQATVDASNIASADKVTFWAKAGTLGTVDIGLYDSSAGSMVSMYPLTLSPVWSKYSLPFRGVLPGHSFRLYVYPGGSSGVSAGSIDVFGFQLSQGPNEYVPTQSTAVTGGSVASRHDEQVTFANQLISTVPTGTSPIVFASTTPVANLTLLTDLQVPTLKSPGKILESALPVISSPGLIQDSALPNSVARLSSPAYFAAPVIAPQLASLAPQGTPPLTVQSSSRVIGLNSDLLDDADWAKPNPIGDETPNTGMFTELTVTKGIAKEGSGMKHRRVPSCSAVKDGSLWSCKMDVLWDFPFADTEYTVTCTEENIDGGHLQVSGIFSKTREGFSVELTSISEGESEGGLLNCIAIHD